MMKNSVQNPRLQSRRPHYVTVGSGSTSESAARLQALLEITDSGYGESVVGESSSSSQSWNPSLTADMPTPSHLPMARGETNEASESERRIQANAIRQLWYQKHRASLARSVNCAHRNSQIVTRDECVMAGYIPFNSTRPKQASPQSPARPRLHDLE